MMGAAVNNMSALSLILFIGTIYFSQSVVAAGKNAQSENKALEEIIATAAKREVGIQDDSMPVSAVIAVPSVILFQGLLRDISAT